MDTFVVIKVCQVGPGIIHSILARNI
uniref:Uncharacterized protein n=1 Tax=Amphimedon queenslandica TaxID=400682 RepID=A0A1X7TY05_AMPQE